MIDGGSDTKAETAEAPLAEHAGAHGGNGYDASLPGANLVNDLEALGALLAQAASDRETLDAFLLAAGINQIAEDYLHDAPFPLQQAVSLFEGFGSPVGRLATRLAGGAGLLIRVLKRWGRAGRRALRWQRRIAWLVDELAEAVVANSEPSGKALDGCRELVLEIPSLPVGLRRAVVHLPACFQAFDQRPEDLERLAARFALRRADRDRPLLVVGLRTSGSYMAPLIAAALRVRGFGRTRAITIRPGRGLLAYERKLVRSLVRAGGQILLTDDPPVTASSLSRAAAELVGTLRLERARVKPGTLVLLLALEDEGAGLPAALAPYEAVVLGPREWSVEARLRPERVRSVLARLLEGELELESLEPLPLPARDRQRSHRRALFRVGGVDPATGAPRRLDVLAVGTGLGYFGTQQLATARALSAFAPRLFGFDDGVLYREWLPVQRQLTADSDELPVAVASYVAARRQALRVDRDMSTAMRGDRPVWEVAALILARGFTPVTPVMRILLVNRVVTRLLSVAQPSVLDGSMSPEHWFAGERDGRVVKASLSDRSFWRLGLGCFDASFDLAGVATCSSHEELADRVRAAWLAETGEEIDPERWLLYELAHLWGALRDDPDREADVLHASARAAARYFARSFFEDLQASPAGPLCALDIDGVLETQQLGFPTLTRASATALRGLVAHGYRPVLVTGRGIDEVRDRCGIYDLQAGVAEYGSAIWVERSKQATGLLDDKAVAALSRLRAVLREREGVRLDPAFSYAIRAYRADINGRRSPLGTEEAAECLATSSCEHSVRTIPGENQTDFVSAVVDKGTGLRALIGALAADHGSEAADAPAVALAVGDTASDAPMLALAQAAFVPAHASQAATTTGARRVRRSYQVGLQLAVGELLGHPPGGCPRCHVPPTTPSGDLLLDLLSAPESGPRALPLRALRLAWKLR